MTKKPSYEELEQRVKEFGKEAVKRMAAQQAIQSSEQRLSLIYDSVEDILFYIRVEPDDCFRFLSINHAFLKATGLTRDQIVGKRVEEVIPETSVRLVLDNYKKAIKENRIVRWEETSGYPTGEKIGDVSIAPDLNKKGICKHIVVSEHDVTKRKQAAEVLWKAHDELERRFEDRTRKLRTTLKIMKRKEKEIIRHKSSLEKVNREIMETNQALSVLARNIDREKELLEKKIYEITTAKILPIIKDLKGNDRLKSFLADLDVLESNLNSFFTGSSHHFEIIHSLTEQEMRVAALIKRDLTNQKISNLLYISEHTVKTHRKNIRKKLKIKNSTVNLASYLKSKMVSVSM